MRRNRNIGALAVVLLASLASAQPGTQLRFCLGSQPKTFNPRSWPTTLPKPFAISQAESWCALTARPSNWSRSLRSRGE